MRLASLLGITQVNTAVTKMLAQLFQQVIAGMHLPIVAQLQIRTIVKLLIHDCYGAITPSPRL